MLDQQRKADFRGQGYLVLSSFFSAEEVASAQADADSLLERSEVLHSDNLRCRWQTHPQSGEPLLDTLDPVTDLSPAIERLARSEKLLDLLEAIYGEPAFLFKDKLIYKPPGALGQAPHQDFISWPGFPKSFLTVLVALDEADETNGCLKVFRGHHARGYLSAMDGDYHDLSESLFDPGSRVALTIKPGDAVVFGCYLPHGSAANLSARSRRHLYLSYNALSDGGDRRHRHYEEFHAWLGKRYAEYGCTNQFFR